MVRRCVRCKKYMPDDWTDDLCLSCLEEKLRELGD